MAVRSHCDCDGPQRIRLIAIVIDRSSSIHFYHIGVGKRLIDPAVSPDQSSSSRQACSHPPRNHSPSSDRPDIHIHIHKRIATLASSHGKKGLPPCRPMPRCHDIVPAAGRLRPRRGAAARAAGTNANAADRGGQVARVRGATHPRGQGHGADPPEPHSGRVRACVHYWA